MGSTMSCVRGGDGLWLRLWIVVGAKTIDRFVGGFDTGAGFGIEVRNTQWH